MNDSRDAIESLMQWLSPKLNEDESRHLRLKLQELARAAAPPGRPAPRDAFSLYDVIGSTSWTSPSGADLNLPG